MLERSIVDRTTFGELHITINGQRWSVPVCCSGSPRCASMQFGCLLLNNLARRKFGRRYKIQEMSILENPKKPFAFSSWLGDIIISIYPYSSLHFTCSKLSYSHVLYTIVPAKMPHSTTTSLRASQGSIYSHKKTGINVQNGITPDRNQISVHTKDVPKGKTSQWNHRRKTSEPLERYINDSVTPIPRSHYGIFRVEKVEEDARKRMQYLIDQLKV